MDKKFNIKDQLAGIAALVAAIVAIGGGFVKYGEVMTKLDTIESRNTVDYSAQIAVLEENLTELCTQILEPTRRNFGKPMIITSGYRSEELCVAIGSKTTSQHAKGQAADFEMIGLDNKSLAKYIKNNLVFDQLILEFYTPNDPSSGWVHCSYNKDENRKEALFYNGKEYTQWSI